jgi:hypothetical protein
MTFIKLALSFFLTCVSAATCQAASPTSDEIVDAFFGPSGIADKAGYYTGEMKRLHSSDQTLGKAYGPHVTFAPRRLPLASPDAPVYAVTVIDRGEFFDWYAYFGPDDGAFKLKAIRAAGPSGFFHDHMLRLAELPARTAEQEWEYRHLQLAFLSDSERIAHFRSRITELDMLKVAIDSRQADAIHEKMRAFHFRGYERGELGHLEIWIGAGLLSSGTVGVLYAPNDLPPPPISEDHYLYIEHIEGPWYAYKAT